MNVWDIVNSIKTVNRWQESVNSNLALSQIAGYKQFEVSFGGNATTIMDQPSNSSSGIMIPEETISVGSTTIDFSQGSLVPAKEWTDVAIDGSGFFMTTSSLDNPDPTNELKYTRNGEWYVDADGYLRTTQGLYVLDGTTIPGSTEPSSTSVPPWDTSSLANWDTRERIRVRNDTNQTITDGSVVEINLNTQDLASQGLMQGDCDDIRVAQYVNNAWTVLPTRIDNTDPTQTKIKFRLTQDLLVGDSETRRYYLFYNNSSAGAGPVDSTIGLLQPDGNLEDFTRIFSPNVDPKTDPVNSVESWDNVSGYNSTQAWRAGLPDSPSSEWHLATDGTTIVGLAAGSIDYVKGTGYVFQDNTAENREVYRIADKTKIGGWKYVNADGNEIMMTIINGTNLANTAQVDFDFTLNQSNMGTTDYERFDPSTISGTVPSIYINGGVEKTYNTNIDGNIATDDDGWGYTKYEDGNGLTAGDNYTVSGTKITNTVWSGTTGNNEYEYMLLKQKIQVAPEGVIRQDASQDIDISGFIKNDVSIYLRDPDGALKLLYSDNVAYQNQFNTTLVPFSDLKAGDNYIEVYSTRNISLVNGDMILPLNSEPNTWSGLNGAKSGTVKYTDGVGYEFGSVTAEKLYVKIKYVSGVPQYTILASIDNGVNFYEPTMEVLDEVKNDTQTLNQFGWTNQGTVVEGAEYGTTGWVNRTDASLINIDDPASGNVDYWHNLTDVYKTNSTETYGGGDIHVSNSVTWDDTLLKYNADTSLEQARVTGTIIGDDGWTLNMKKDDYTDLPVGWSDPTYGTGYGLGTIQDTPSLSGNLSNDPDTDGTWTRVFSAGSGNVNGTALPDDPNGTKTANVPPGNGVTINVGIETAQLDQTTTLLVSGLDRDTGKVYSTPQTAFAENFETNQWVAAAGGWTPSGQNFNYRTSSMWYPGATYDNHPLGSSGDPIHFRNTYNNPYSYPVDVTVRTGEDACARFFINGEQFSTSSGYAPYGNYDYCKGDQEYTITLKPGDNIVSIEAFDDNKDYSNVQLYTVGNNPPGSGINIKADSSWEAMKQVRPDGWTMTTTSGGDEAAWRVSDNTAHGGSNSLYYGTDENNYDIKDTIIDQDFETNITSEGWTVNSINGSPNVNWGISTNKGTGTNYSVSGETSSAYFGNSSNNYENQNLILTQQSFEGSGIPSGWTVNSTSGDPEITWRTSSNTASDGSKSAYVGNAAGTSYQSITTVLQNNFETSSLTDNGWSVNNLYGSPDVQWRPSSNTVPADGNTQSAYFGNAAGNSYSLGEGAEKIDVMISWDGAGSDIDMHVYEPGGEHTFYSDKTNNGVLNRDITDGGWNDTYTAAHPVTAPNYTFVAGTSPSQVTPTNPLDTNSNVDEWYTVTNTRADGSGASTLGNYTVKVLGYNTSAPVDIWVIEDMGTDHQSIAYEGDNVAITKGVETTIGTFALAERKRVGGEIISPSFDLTGKTTATLTFEDSFVTEANASYDKKEVYYSTDGGSHWQLLTTKGTGTQAWQNNTVSLPADCNNKNDVKIKFVFDSIDGKNNNYRGWNIDNIKLTAEEPIKTELISPAMSTINYLSGRVKFDESWNTDGSTDKRTLYVTSDGGTTWQPITSSTTPAVGAWTSRSVELKGTDLNGNAYDATNKANVKFKWEFDSVNTTDNDQRGWNVDNVRVEGETRVQSELLSPKFSTKGYETGQMTFEETWDTGGPANEDKRTLQITTNGGTTWQTVRDSSGASEQATWGAVSVNLADYSALNKDNVQFKWTFDSVTSTNNKPDRGWNIDNVKVTGGKIPKSEITTPNIDLSKYSDAKMTFWSSFNVDDATDPRITPNTDNMSLYIWNGGTSQWETIYPQFVDSDGNPQIQDWTKYVVKLPDWALYSATTGDGRSDIKFKWAFDALDLVDNDQRGWNIDDIDVTGTKVIESGQSWAGDADSGVGTSSLKVGSISASSDENLAITARTITKTTVNRYKVDSNGNVIDLFGDARDEASTGHSNGSSQISNADGILGNSDDYGYYDYVPDLNSTYIVGELDATKSGLRIDTGKSSTDGIQSIDSIICIPRYTTTTDGWVVDRFGNGVSTNNKNTSMSSNDDNVLQSETAVSGDDENLIDYSPNAALTAFKPDKLVNVPIYESKLVQLKNNISEDRILTDGSDWQYAGASTWNEYMLQMDFGISTPNATGNTYVYLRQTDSTHWVRLQYDYNNKKMTLQSNSGSGVVNVDSKTFTDANDPMLDPVNTGANLVAKVSGKRVEVYMNSNLVFNTTISNMSLYGGIALGSTRASWYDNLKISPLSLVSAETLGNLGLIQANDANDILDQLNVVQFADQGSLSYDRGYGAVYFNQTNQSGQYISTKPGEYGAGRISTNYLEASNVNMGKQLTNLTSAKSAFEVLSKQLSVYLGTVDVGLNLLR